MITAILFSVGFVAACICCVAEYQKRHNQKTRAVYLPDDMLWIGLIGGVMFLVMTWVSAILENRVGITIGFGCFVVLSVVVLFGWKNCYITYDQERITQRNWIGMQRSFTYAQVTGFSINKTNPMESHVYAAGKKISFNWMSANGQDFLAILNAGYRKTHGNTPLPKVSGLRKAGGGFCAHVYNPEEYLAIFVLILAILVGLSLWLTADIYRPLTAEDGESYTVAFRSWEIQGKTLVLTSAQEQGKFKIYDYETYMSNFDQLIDQCDGNTVFNVCARYYEPDDADPYFVVYALESNGEVYRTFEDSTAYRRKDLPILSGFSGIILGVFLAFSWLVYAVGSNPEKYPRWLVYCIFKKEAINI